MLFKQRSFEWVKEPIASLPQPVQVNDPIRGRYYITPDGVELMSVTTFLGKIGDKSFLDEWRQRVGEEEADRITEEASVRGSYLHETIEAYLQQESDWKQRALKAPLFKTMKTSIDLSIGKIYGKEFRLYSDYLNLAGTCDLCAEWNTKTSIVDWKSSRKLKKIEWIDGYFMQTCIYSILLQERTGIKAEQLVIVMGVDGESKPQVFVQDRAIWIPRVMNAVRLMGLLSIPERRDTHGGHLY